MSASRGGAIAASTFTAAAARATGFVVERSVQMTLTIDALQERMEAAARALDFEEASRCRDMIAMMRGGATLAEAEAADFAGLERQKPGAMGLGTSQQSVTPPTGWQRPSRPDPMTAGRSRRGRRRGE